MEELFTIFKDLLASENVEPSDYCGLVLFVVLNVPLFCTKLIICL